MTITPKEAGQVTRNELMEIRKLERDIDKVIMEKFSESDRSVCYNLDASIPDRVLKKVCENYRQAGWNVRKEYDQREGAWLEFRPIRGDY